MIDFESIAKEYNRRVENGLSIPTYLQKQAEGLLLFDEKKDLSVVIEGLLDERDHLDKLLDRDWMDGLSDEQWMAKLAEMHGMEIIK